MDTAESIINQTLFEKYNIPVPRYTSYPAVPDWQNQAPTQKDWIYTLNQNLLIDNEISLYIHLPFCENLCTYCACNKRITKNHKVESPYVDMILAEWQLYLDQLEKRPVIRELHLGGGTPTFFHPDVLDRLLTGIIASTELSSSHSLSFEAHPNSTTTRHLEVLYSHGFRRISIGIQDVNPNILKAINRHQTTEQIESMTMDARRIGYTSINYDIIYGLPFQTINHIEETLQFVLKMKPDRLAFYGYAHVPWKSKGQRAFTDNDIAKGIEKQRLKDHGDSLLVASGYKSIGMDHYALESDPLYLAQKSGRLHRNFMGFTEHNTRCLIGLGNSAISDCTNMYVQNEKVVETYQSAIAKNNLPIINGHKLSPIEQRTKKHILNLICNYTTSFEDDILDQNLRHSTLAKLEELISDGMIALTDNRINVTPTGRPFVRNVCAAIDPNSNKQIGHPRFSKAI